MKNTLKIFFTIFVVFISINVSALEVKYEGANKGIIVGGDDLFGNVDLVYPGDFITDEVTINNTTKIPLEVYFKVNNDNSSLSNVLLLNITLLYDGVESTIYNGNFKANSLRDYISLGTYKSGFNGKLKFTLSIPASVDNTYADADFKSIVTFKVEDNGYNGTDVIDPITDTNGDGVINGDDDQDNDGIVDSLDDSDGDGVTDDEDADTRGGRDTNGDGKINGEDDWDLDGIPDATDDSDGDGIVDNEDPDIRGNREKDGGYDTDGDGKITPNDDWDHDGVLDKDDDWDGDGIPDSEDLDTRGGIDSNNDGRINGDDDWDGDGIPDGIDDSDGDGIVDNEDPDIRGPHFPNNKSYGEKDKDNNENNGNDGKDNGKNKHKPIISPTTYDDIAKYFIFLVLSIGGIVFYFVNTKKIEGE